MKRPLVLVAALFLSGRERRILDQRLDRSRHRIYRYKHDHRQVAALCAGRRGYWEPAWP